jgi:hypothetical protein
VFSARSSQHLEFDPSALSRHHTAKRRVPVCGRRLLAAPVWLRKAA